jgi:hypothetical protein
LDELKRLHPFFGITFLVCKQESLPVEQLVHFEINALEASFLERYHKPEPRSQHYYQPYRTSRDRWLSRKYPSSGSQKTRTQGDLAQAFVHPRDSHEWAWAANYLDVLTRQLARDGIEHVPAFWLAVWLYRNREWSDSTTASDLTRTFKEEFRIDQQAWSALFDVTIPTLEAFFSPDVFSEEDLLRLIGLPPDVAPSEGGTLQRLELSGIGPSEDIEFMPGDRLTVITGDNGLGKTFLLEAAWWSLTGGWVDRPLLPRIDGNASASMTFQLATAGATPQPKRIKFDYTAQSWPTVSKPPALPGLVVYARVDGSFAICDPARYNPKLGSGAITFSREDVLKGLEGKIEGLLRDWISWQYSPDRTQFQTFKSVLECLSPPDMPLVPGEPQRLPFEPRQLPTLHHSFGVVPFIHESAAIRRIVTLGYLLVWAWNEHKVASGLARKPPQSRVVILIDEIESHLHPKWQRLILPALMDVASRLGVDVKPQLLVTTHSPLILASLETRFDDTVDALYHLRLEDNGEVDFSDVPFVRYGRVDEWLTSDIFELRQARSAEAERAIEKARELFAHREPSVVQINAVSLELASVLPSDDEFWRRWNHFVASKEPVP